MSAIMSYIVHIPEALSIALLGLLAMNCMTIPSVILGVKKVRKVGLASVSVWKSMSLPAIALNSAGVATRNLFFAYALIYPAYLNNPNILTIVFGTVFVVAIALNALARFYKAQKTDESGIALTGKVKITHDKYVQTLIKRVDTYRKLSTLRRIK